MTVRLGQDVHFVSRTGNYELAAKVCATQATLFPGGVTAGSLPGLINGQVHLTVFSPGPSGQRAAATNFVSESPHGRNENQGGTYTEWAIDIDPHGAPGTFHDPLACPFGVDGGLPR